MSTELNNNISCMLNALLLPENDPLHLQTHTLFWLIQDYNCRSNGSYRMGWRCCVNYYPFPPLDMCSLFFPFFKCRILHNIIALLLSFPQLTSYWQRVTTTQNGEGFHHMLIYICRAISLWKRGENRNGIWYISVCCNLAQTGGIC